MHLNNSTNHTDPTTATSPVCLAVGAVLARLTREVPALLLHAAPYLALVSQFSSAWPQAKRADPRGKAIWEACWLSRFLSASLLIDLHNYIRSNPDWRYLPVLVGKGEKIATDYVCGIRRGETFVFL